MQMLWWLELRAGGAVIIGGNSAVHARLRAIASDFGRPSDFGDGYEIDPRFENRIPDECRERKLSVAEVKEVVRLLGRQ